MLSASRVLTRVAKGGHAVEAEKLLRRFPRTQNAIRHALPIADGALLIDNSRSDGEAFTVCCIDIAGERIFDIRDGEDPVAAEIQRWMRVVVPRTDAERGSGR